MSDSDNEEQQQAVQIARLEVKVDSILDYLRQDRDYMKERFEDHEQRLRRGEELGDPREVLNSVNARLDDLEKHAKKTDRWIHAIPVGTAIAFVVAVGALVSYVTNVTP